ncbi:MAG TPA: hypothetical protein OIM45_07200 [Clostridiaceae bacterium]|nr:hypothetical protein [Clostridiaceae bacterium]
MDNSLRKSYSEVYEILNLMDSAYLDKIPDKVKDLITNERDKEFKTNITTDISLEKQGLQRDTLTVLAILYLNYWCESEQEKKELIELFNEVDKTNAEKYSYDNIFKKNKEIPIQEVIKENNNSLVEYKESIFSRIINKIKEIFFKNKY